MKSLKEMINEKVDYSKVGSSYWAQPIDEVGGFEDTIFIIEQLGVKEEFYCTEVLKLNIKTLELYGEIDGEEHTIVINNTGPAQKCPMYKMLMEDKFVFCTIYDSEMNGSIGKIKWTFKKSKKIRI